MAMGIFFTAAEIAFQLGVSLDLVCCCLFQISLRFSPSRWTILNRIRREETEESDKH